MDTNLVDKIRSRVRKLSQSQALAQTLTEEEVKYVIKLQAYWRMVLLRQAFRKKLKRKEKRRFVIEELWKTEKEYITDMRLVVERVMREVEGFLDEEMFNMLFINLEDIISLHEKFYARLDDGFQHYDHNSTRISEFILFLTPQLKESYYTFCLEYSKSNQILRLLNISNTQFKNHILGLKKQGVLRGELASYLIKPVQRICKYSLLLKELIKYTDEDHSDFGSLQDANAAIKKIVQETNDKIE